MKRNIDFSLGGEAYTVTTDFSTIELIEERFDLMSFMRSIQSYKTRIKDIAWVLYSAVRAAGYSVSYQDIGNAVTEDFESATAAALRIAANVLSAGPEKATKKKVKDSQSTPE